MIRALNTGVSGLTNHQVRMDVVGNNIANVNTIAYKRSRAAFNEVMAQEMMTVGRFPGGTDTNPSFVGLGMRVSSIDKNWGQGALEVTDIAEDLALQGDGFFIVRSSTLPNSPDFLTRAGNMVLNSSGDLVTSSGLNVQGFGFDANGNLDLTTLQDVNINFSATASPKYSENASVAGNLSNAAQGPTASAPDPATSVAMSKVFYDQQGTSHEIVVTFTKTDNPNEWSFAITGAALDAGHTEDTGTILFNPDGTFNSATTASGGATPSALWDAQFVDLDGDSVNEETITLDFSALTQLAGVDSAKIDSQDGFASGQLEGYEINAQGMISLIFSNGQRQSAYQLAIGHVNNVNGLEQLGENLYTMTNESGDLQRGRAGNEFQTAVVSGALEMSNVDLATEFSEMIKTQRGYQASARVIRTADEILTELVNLKR